MAKRPTTTGVVKAVPKSGETKAEALARVQAAHPGEKVVDPPSGSNGKRNGRSSSSPFGATAGRSGYGELVGKEIFPVKYEVRGKQPTFQHPQYDGSVYSTPYGRDPFRTNKVEVAIFEYPNVNWTLWQTVGGQDASAILVGQRTLQIFQLIIDVINYNGRFTPNQVLTTIGDFATYLTNWTIAFTGLYTLMSIPMAMDLNQSTRIITTTFATGGLVDRTAYDWKRLNMIPMPPMMEDVMAKLCGIFANDAQEVVYFSHVNTGASLIHVTDFTLNTGVDSISALLTTIETALTALEVGTAEGNVIQEVMAMVYGPPRLFKDPQIHTEPCEYDYCFTRAVQVKDTTAGTFSTVPQINLTTYTPGSPVPILVRKGTEDKQLFTLFRPQAYSIDSAGFNATVHTSGLLNVGGGTANYGRVYGPLAANNTILTDQRATAAFGTFDFGGTGFYELEWWSPLATSNAVLNKWEGDVRDYDRWHEYYVQNANIGTNTIQLLDEIFLTSVGIRALR